MVLLKGERFFATSKGSKSPDLRGEGIKVPVSNLVWISEGEIVESGEG